MSIYSRAKIYKLCSSKLEKCYIGATCNELRVRKQQHKEAYNAWKKNPKRDSITTSRQIFEAGGDITITLIEEFPCANKMELERRERFHIEQNNCVNRCLPAPTKEEKENYQREYYLRHQEEKKKKVREYRKTNAENINQSRREKYHLKKRGPTLIFIE